MYKFYIEKWFKDQEEFERWIWKEIETGYRLHSIKSFGYVPVIRSKETKENDSSGTFIAEQVVFAPDKEMKEEWIAYQKLMREGNG